MTGKTVQLPWGKATVEEEATVAGSASERAMELGVARLSGADGEQLLRFFYRADGRTVRGPLTLRPAEVAALALELRKQPALRKLVAGSASDAALAGRARAGRARARRRAPPRSPRAPPRRPTGRAPRSPASLAFESTGKSSPATRCQVPMPPSAAAANGPDVLPAARVAEAHDLVHRLRRGDAVVDDPERLAQERVLQAVPDEAGHVALHEHRALAAARDGRARQLDRLGAAVRAGDHLDQRHQQRRVPVVRADRALGRAAGLADLADRERRGVAARSRRPGSAPRSASAPRP